MNKHSIDTTLETSYANAKICMSKDAKNNIKNIYAQDFYFTSIKKRILVYQIILILGATVFIPISAIAASYISNSIYEQLYEKVKDANLSEEEFDSIMNDFINDPEAINGIKYLDELHINENGLTYGPDALGADLISVISDQGELGYVYREELYNHNVNSLEEAIAYEEEVTILTVYASDGITVIGTFSIK